MIGELARAQVAPAHTAFMVVPLDGGALQLAQREDAPMNPASTMKLLTTYAALSRLGPDYRWHTAVFASQAPHAGRLDGDLIVRGDGDPSLVIERWWLLVQRVRAMGVKDITGDLVIDRSRYAPAVESGPSLDHNDLRPYNVAPDALLINFKALSLDFVPDARAGVAHVVALPPLDGVAVPAQVPLARGACGDWKARLKADFSNPKSLRLRGAFPAACGERAWQVSPLGADAYALASFRALWRQAGGSFHGRLRSGRAGAGAVALAVQDSPPLADVIRDINKNSNNVMARQLFLTLGVEDAGGGGGRTDGVREDSARAGSAAMDVSEAGAESPAAAGEAAAPEAESVPIEAGPGAELSDAVQSSEPATAALAIAAMHRWLEQQGLAMPELVLQNGSGLSRQERISAGSLARLLEQAWRSADMPNFLASLPLAGVDGTMQHRTAARHAAYVKTGYLSEVRALAGYVFAASGRHYVIVALVNDPHAEAAQDAVDAFLQWVWMRG